MTTVLRRTRGVGRPREVVDTCHLMRLVTSFLIHTKDGRGRIRTKGTILPRRHRGNDEEARVIAVDVARHTFFMARCM